jgi:hypothetical protein
MFDKPTFLVQVGWQGKKRAMLGAEYDYIDGAILSPSDYVRSSLEDLAEKLNNHSKHVFFDPQFYLPDQGDRDKLNRYDYHDRFGGDDFESSVFFDKAERSEFFREIIDLQDRINCSGYISPSHQISSLSEEEIDDWKQITEAFVKEVNDLGKDIPIFATLSVSGDHLTDSSLREHLLNKITMIDVDGFYITVEYDDSDSRLPLQGKNKVQSYIDLLMTLKINRYNIIAANTHQIAHLLFPIQVDAFSSGHFNNLRAFDTDRWVVPDDPTPKQRVTRYYSDELLSDVRPDHLLTEIANSSDMDPTVVQSDTTSPWEDDLFDDGSVDVGWPDSEGGWDHYMYCCGQIAEQYDDLDKNERLNHAKKKIRKAKALHRKIEEKLDEHTDEVGEDFLENWETVLMEIEDSPKFRRL